MAKLIDKELLLMKIDELFHSTAPDDENQHYILQCRTLVREAPEEITGEGRRAMISQPMRDISPEEIHSTRHDASKWLVKHGFNYVDSYFPLDDMANNPIYCLAKSIEFMSSCKTVLFCHGWESARGCQIEHSVAEAYGLQVLYQDENGEVKEKAYG